MRYAQVCSPSDHLAMSDVDETTFSSGGKADAKRIQHISASPKSHFLQFPATSREVNHGLFPLFSALSHGSAVQLALLLIRGLLSAANNFLGSLTCNHNDVCFQMAPFILSACGLDSSWYYSGYPQVNFARVLSLRPAFGRAVREITPGYAQLWTP